MHPAQMTDHGIAARQLAERERMKRQLWIGTIIRPYIQLILSVHGGNMPATARALGAPLRSLQEWVRRLELVEYAAKLRGHK